MVLKSEILELKITAKGKKLTPPRKTIQGQRLEGKQEKRGQAKLQSKDCS